MRTSNNISYSQFQTTPQFHLQLRFKQFTQANTFLKALAIANKIVRNARVLSEFPTKEFIVNPNPSS